MKKENKFALIDASNVIRYRTGDSNCNKSPLVIALDALTRGLRRGGYKPISIGDIGLWSERPESANPSVERLCERYRDRRSLRLWCEVYSQTTFRSAGACADVAILSHAQKLIDLGREVVIVTNDGFIDHTANFDCLDQFRLGSDKSMLLCPFEVRNWMLEVPALGLKAAVWSD